MALIKTARIVGCSNIANNPPISLLYFSTQSMMKNLHYVSLLCLASFFACQSKKIDTTKQMLLEQEIQMLKEDTRKMLEESAKRKTEPAPVEENDKSESIKCLEMLLKSSKIEKQMTIDIEDQQKIEKDIQELQARLAELKKQ